MEKNNEVRLKKIPLFILLEALRDVYNRGVDYVDIIGVPGEEQDSIGISVKEEYFASEYQEDDDDDASKEITDEDLNQLI
jgi:hypothetical protein